MVYNLNSILILCGKVFLCKYGDIHILSRPICRGGFRQTPLHGQKGLQKIRYACPIKNVRSSYLPDQKRLQLEWCILNATTAFSQSI